MKTKLSKERLLLAGLLLAAGGGLAFEQFSSAAETVPEDDYTVAAPSAGASQPRTPITPERQLAARLLELAGPMPASADAVRDVFSIVSAPVAAEPVVITEAEPVAPAATVSPAWAARVLNGVLFGADGKGVAIVDGRMVPVGARFDGMRLTRVTKQIAVFSDGAAEITLRLKEK